MNATPVRVCAEHAPYELPTQGGIQPVEETPDAYIVEPRWAKARRKRSGR